MQTGMISNRIHDARSITILKMSWMKISVFALDGKYPFVSMQKVATLVMFDVIESGKYDIGSVIAFYIIMICCQFIKNQ